MRVPRLHVPEPLVEGAALRLDEAPARHVRSVLRLKPGARLVVFDGRGNAHHATLTGASRAGVQVEVGAPCAGGAEPALRVTLALGISRGERMDLAVQKSVELGVACIRPLITERSVVRLDANRAARRESHWRGVAISACEQCGRDRVPEVAPVSTLDAFLAGAEAHGLRLVPHPGAGTGLRGLRCDPAQGVTLLIGPEGGLAEAERALTVDHGFTAVRMGPRVLRTETAVIAAMACVMTLWGDLGD